QGCSPALVATHGCDAERTFGVLPGRVRPARRPRLDIAGVDRERAARQRQRHAVEPARCRAELVLTGAVVLRAVAGALEPLRRLAERDAAAEVDASLVQRHQSAGEQAGVLVDALFVVG